MFCKKIENKQKSQNKKYVNWQESVRNLKYIIWFIMHEMYTMNSE